MIVVDASVLANMLVYADDRGRKARAVLARDTEWSAPEHWKAEVFSVIRGLTLGRKITEAQGLRVVERLPQLGIDTVPLDDLLPRMWQLRAGVSGYDAAYVALAEARGLTLVTSDGRLARTATTFCRVELVS
ncbi:type II toxin-antitoxin system VapC family toxin [Actinokineospora xionganensis]|uniref:Ribonuclease VapC n=1 Tax=Actinokineospora xionganensis TaxID=2684470 RepID=A0ABR7LCK4_9PSEU|nr:type II toxin-antitoxin system VapC family toxin [Actinokineospora xionganensis]MBC6450318.1 type II toxin-antitoxin system VapC family toxin [Actinokineospora xionganensis]